MQPTTLNSDTHCTTCDAVLDGFVSFPYQVSYELLSDFIAKDYNGRFGPDFTFEELQAYLRPMSPLRRLVVQ
jgi:hypothetical protein